MVAVTESPGMAMAERSGPGRYWRGGGGLEGRRVRGIRGATCIGHNTPDAILAGTRSLLLTLQEANGFALDDIVAAFFTVTRDLDAAFAATAARELGWDRVPLLGAVEADVPGALPRCVRVLLQV